MELVEDLDAGAASLYIGDLNLDVDEAILFEKFSKMGYLLGIHIPKDSSTGQSLGYAYVNYLHPSDAERARETLNGDLIEGKPCRIRWAKSVGKVFVRNLDASVDDQLLCDTFSKYGHVMVCKVTTDEENESKGYGTVHLDTETAAQAAIDALDQMPLKGKVISVEHFLSRKEREAMGSPTRKAQYTNVYVRQFSDHVTEEKFKGFFREFGTINSVKLMPAKQPGLSRFAFVDFDKHEAAKNCVDSLHGKEKVGLTAEGQTLHIEPFKNKEERTVELQNKSYEGVNLYVSNLDDVIDDERLETEFASFGNIINAKVMRDEKNCSRGFGFVRFSTADEAIAAISEMDGRILVNRRLNVCPHQKKYERKNRLAAQYMDKMAQDLRDQQRQQTSRPAADNVFIDKERFASPLQSRIAPAATVVPEWRVRSQSSESAPAPPQRTRAAQSDIPEQREEQPQEQKQMLAVRLFSLIGKIGTLLPHIDNSELQTMLDHNENVLAKYEAIAALKVEKAAASANK